jgi:hypothetical protein
VSYDGGFSVSLNGEPLRRSGLPAEDVLSHRLEFEENVAACMTDAGFEYVAFVPTDLGPWQRMKEIFDLSEAEFVDQYGYGISTLLEDQEGARRAAAEDPNLAIREAMSDEDRGAYAKALFGDGDNDGIRSDTFGGCHGQALDVWYGGESERPAVRWSALADDLANLGSAIEGDTRVREAVARWSACMAEAGFTHASQLDQVQLPIFRKLDELPGSTEAGVSFDDVDPDDLREIQDFEREVAEADYNCRDESQYREELVEVQFELEAEFVDEHREQLEAFRDWLREQPRHLS